MTNNGDYLCEADHGSANPRATWYATMPTSDSPSALVFLCTPCYAKTKDKMASEGWVFRPVDL